jgi:hypothetical protein
MPTPPTIASLKAMDVAGFRVTCARADCQHSGLMTFDAAGVADDAPFPSIAKRRSFVCAQCSGRAVSIMPDWRGHKAGGLARLNIEAVRQGSEPIGVGDAANDRQGNPPPG